MGSATSPPPPDYNHAQIVHQASPQVQGTQSPPPQQYFAPQQQQQQQQQQSPHPGQGIQSPPVQQYYSNEKSQAPHQAPQQVQQQQQNQNGPHPVPLYALGEQPGWVSCPVCRTTQMTRVNYVAGTTTHLWALALCCCLCLGCIPYCVSGLKNAEHHCGQCGAHLATFKRSGGIEVAPGAAAHTGAAVHTGAAQSAPQKN